MRVAGMKMWLGLKLMMVLAAIHLAYFASSQIKGIGVDAGGNQPSSLSAVPYAPNSAFTIGADAPALAASRALKRPLRWAIFTPPKAFSKAPHQLAALRSWLGLRVPPQVFLVEAADLDREELRRLEEEYGVKTATAQTNSEGMLRQDTIFERASREQGLDVVVVLNSDIILGDDFVDALEHAEATFQRFLMVGARYDNLTPEDVPPDADREWVAGFRERTLRDGVLHTYGGSDYFAWRPVGDPALAAVGGRIPPFTYGRSKADNWIIEAAVRNGVVEVIDASTAVVALHPAHGYANVAALAAAAPATASSGGSTDAAPADAAPAAAALPDPSAVAAAPAVEARDRGRGLKAVETKWKEEGQHPAAGGRYVNFWSAKSNGDPQADMNKHLAYTFGRYENGEGTPLHAPWQLMRCVEAAARPALGGGFGYVERPCLRHRVRPAACPCEHASAVANTLTEVQVDGKRQQVCGKAPLTRSETFEADFALRELVSQQAVDRTVVLIGFNYGYQDMLMNMVCRLNQLRVPNYVIAAFDADAFAFCRRQVLPCFPVSPEVAAKADAILKGSSSSADTDGAEGEGAEGRRLDASSSSFGSSSSSSVDGGARPAAQAFGTQGFRALTKLKSQQVLRILEMGYNVMWSDVDIFWKVDPIPGVLAEMVKGGGADIGIQSNAPPTEAAENGLRRINSGFYYAKSNPASVEAFRQIVAHARQSKLSEQPSFYTVLCGDGKEYVQGTRACLNTAIPVATRFLSRQLYPNGAMRAVVEGVTPSSPDAVEIVHFNWLEGHDAKVQSFVDAGMWMLDPRTGACMWDSPTRGAAPALVAAVKAEAQAAAAAGENEEGDAVAEQPLPEAKVEAAAGQQDSGKGRRLSLRRREEAEQEQQRPS